MQVLSLAQPLQPALLSGFGDGLAAQRLDIGDGIAALSGFNTVRFVDLKTVQTTTPGGRIDRVPQANGLRVANGVAYIAAAGDGLQIFDVHAPLAPHRLASFRPSADFTAGALELSGNYLYVASYQRGIDVLDISNPAAPTLLGTLSTFVPSLSTARMQVVGKRLYLGAPGGDLDIFDLSTPWRPQKAGFYSFESRGINGFQVVNTIAYITVSFSNLHIVDLANPASPKLLKSFTLPDTGGPLAVRNGLAYIVYGSNGDIAIVNVANSANPILLKTITLDAQIYHIQTAGTIALVGHDLKLSIMDLSAPSAPIVRGTAALNAVFGEAQVDGRIIYVADSSGLHVFWYVPAATATRGPAGGSLTSSPDQTSYLFATGTFTASTVLTHTPRFQGNAPPTGALIGIDHAFELSALNAATSQPVAPTKPYTITVRYTNAERGPAIESTLALYVWDGAQWAKAPGSVVNTSADTITATTTHVGLFSVLGETRRIYAPVVQRS
jgi:hypothetical protein